MLESIAFLLKEGFSKLMHSFWSYWSSLMLESCNTLQQCLSPASAGAPPHASLALRLRQGQTVRGSWGLNGIRLERMFVEVVVLPNQIEALDHTRS